MNPAWAAGESILGSPGFRTIKPLLGFHEIVHLPSFLAINTGTSLFVEKSHARSATNETSLNQSNMVVFRPWPCRDVKTV